MASGELRPLGVGEILDLGINIYRRRFGSLVRAVAYVVVPVSVISAIIEVSVSRDVTTGSVDAADAGAAILGTLIAGLLSYVAAQLATAASFQIVAGDYLGTVPTPEESLQVARSKLWSLMWLSLLYGLSLALGFILCLVPGVYLFAAFSLGVPVLLFEDIRGRGALSRSRALVKGRWWPTAGVLLVSTLLAGIVSGAVSGLLLAVASSGDNAAIEIVVRAIASSASSVLTTPFSAAVITVLYFDARVRKEGFDLELLARTVGVEPPPGAPPSFAPEPVAEEPPFWPPPPGWRPGGPSPDA